MADLTVSPNPAAVGQPIYIEGCGYEVEPAKIEVVDADGDVVTMFHATMLWTGCLWRDAFMLPEAGEYIVNAYQGKGKKDINDPHAKIELRASSSLVVA